MALLALALARAGEAAGSDGRTRRERARDVSDVAVSSRETNFNGATCRSDARS
jgi:hypothetical protein